MSSYIITAEFYDKELGTTKAKFALGFSNIFMADVFDAVNDFDNGEDIDKEDRTFNGNTYDFLEELISDNPDSFAVEWLEGNDDGKLKLESIDNILVIS